MARSQESFGKKEKEKKRLKKRQEKLKKKEERKGQERDTSLESMMAYVDEYGNIVDTPPDPAEKEEIDVESIMISTPKKEEEEENARTKGRVEFFNEQKGFGFIKGSRNGEKYFVHVKSLMDNIILKENDMVTFDVEEGMKGLSAVNVQKA